MSEDEAKSKLCCGPPAYAQAALNTVSLKCGASACMAWRRSTVFIDRATGEPAIPGKASLGDLELRYSGEGYCGIAGAPQ